MSDDDFDIVDRAALDGDDPDTVLASAYLDGEVTSDERALVETSPDVLDDVRRFGDVRTVLSATAPEASLSEREDHLAGALDVWARTSDLERSGEATPGAGLAGAAASPRSTRRGARRRTRRRSADGFGASQWFLSAAAVLVVVAGGAAVVRGIVTQDDTVDDVAIEAPESDAPAGIEDIDSLEAAEVAGENVGADEVLTETQLEDEVASSGDGERAEADTGLFADDAVTEEAADAAADAETAPAEAPVADEAIQPAPAPEDDLPVLAGSDQLADFGALVIPALEASPIVTSDIDFEPPPDSCEAQLGVEQIAGVVVYDGSVVTVGVDLDRDLVVAYVDDSATLSECAIVDTVQLPEPDPQP